MFKLIKSLMMISGCQMVIDVFLPQLEHKQAKMREDVINFILFALLTFPSKEFGMCDPCENFKRLPEQLIPGQKTDLQSGISCRAAKICVH